MGIQTNLGNGPFDKMKPEIVSYELTNNALPEIRKNNTPQNYCLALEIMLVKFMLEGKKPNIDFTYLEINKKNISLKERCELIENELKSLK